MKKSFLLVFSFAIMVFIAISVFRSGTAYSNVKGPNAGFTGSPFDGATCANPSCHGSYPLQGDKPGWITSNVPSTGYVGGTTYTFTAKAVYKGRSVFGFQISPQDVNGTILGQVIVTSTTKTQLAATGYIEHTQAGTAGTDSVVWNFNWKAPAAGTGPVTFYGAFNCTDNNTQPDGDYVFTSQLVVPEQLTSGDDAGISSIISPAIEACSSVSPLVVISNNGNTTLTSATISYFLDTNTPSVYSWSGSLSSGGSAQVSLPAISVSATGTHTLTAQTSAPNGNTDAQTLNDKKTSTFVTSVPAATLTYNQSFDVTPFPPVGWSLGNPDKKKTWIRIATAHHTGAASVYMDNYNYSVTDGLDDLVSTPFDLTGNTSAALTFYVAYAPYTNPPYDSLEVLVSTDCGSTYQSVYMKGGPGLGTAAATTAKFVPTSTQWRQETVSLNPFVGNDVIIKFRNHCYYSNELYIDDIQVSGGTGVSELSESSFDIALFPNPNSGNFNLNYTLPKTSTVNIELYSMNGQKMVSVLSSEKENAGKYSIPVSLNSTASSGVYFLKINIGDKLVLRKVIVQ